MKRYISVFLPLVFFTRVQAAPPRTIPDQILGGPPIQTLLDHTAISNTPTVCRIASGLVTLLAPGTCSLSNTQPFQINQARPSGALTTGPGSPFQVGPNVYAVAVGDFNLDGIPDIASANGGGNNVTVLLGNGAGSFGTAPGSPFAAGPGPLGLVVGDFNGDGLPDLAVANSSAGAGSITILLGNGQGGFLAPVPIALPAGTGPVSLAIGDFNGDGFEDLAAADRTNNTILLLSGNGTGGFTISTSGPMALGTSCVAPVALVVGDFNGDGYQDIAAANQVTANVAILLGNGAGAFSAGPAGLLRTGAQPFSITTGDFNGDGNLDLATADNAGNTITILLGNGSGGFSTAPGSPISVTSPWSVAVADINGDGNPDLIAGAAGMGIVVLTGNGRGGFTVTTGPPSSAIPISLAVADFNGDGVVDVAAANYGTSTVSMYLGGVAATAIAVTATSATVPLGQPISLTAAVTDTGIPFSAPTGLVTFMDGSTLLGAASQTSAPYTFLAANLTGGTHAITAFYSGDSRSLPATSSAITVQEGGATPTVTTLSPTSWTPGGPAFTITVKGTGFAQGAQVQWNGSPLITHFVSATQVTASVTANTISSAGVTAISVADPWAVSNAVQYSQLLPAITTLSPAGWLVGGVDFTLTVTGTGFVQGSQVQWNGFSLTTRFVSATQLTVSVTASNISTAGVVSVAVSNAPGAFSNSLQYAEILPTLATISPTGYVVGDPDLTLTLTGTGFSQNSQVQWNGASLATKFVSATQLTASVPAVAIAVAGTANIAVSNAPGATSNTLQATAILPSVTSLSPAAGWLIGGPDFTLTVNGTGFVANSQVQWNGSAQSTKFISATQLTAAVGAGTIAQPGAATVTVSNAPGATSSGLQFPSILPNLTTLSPKTWTVGGPDFILTVNGTGFVQNSQVQWNGSPLNTKYVSATQVTAAASAALIAVPAPVNIAVTNAVGAVSNGLTYSATPPSITTLSPTSSLATAIDFKLCVTGKGFGAGAAVQWNGTALSTTFVSATNLCAQVSGSLIAAKGTATISVLNPDGGTSATMNFAINQPVPTVPQGSVVPIYSSSTVVQPGSWVSIFGTNLANCTYTWNGDFPTSLGGTSVTINGKPAYLWSVSPTQINLQAPDDTATGPVKVAITTPFGPVSSTVTLAASGPSFSLWPASHYPAAIILTPDGNDLLGPTGKFTFATRPVMAGEIVSFYGVGFGPTNPPVPAGAIFSGAAPTITPATVTIGGVSARVLFCGIVGSGLYQLTVIIPKTPSGDQAMVAKVGTSQTQTGVLISVK